MPDAKLLSAPTIRRLPSYLTIVRQHAAEGQAFISGTSIAQELNLEPIQVRKDLSITGIAGKPKKGYPVAELITAIERFLGWEKPRAAILVGAGNLGSALIGHRDFREHGLNLVAAFDIDPARAGRKIHGRPVYRLEELAQRIRELGISLAVLTVPPEAAQETAQSMVDAGIDAIWNFTNVKLKLPSQVMVQREDLSSGFALLSVMMKRSGGGEQR